MLNSVTLHIESLLHYYLTLPNVEFFCLGPLLFDVVLYYFSTTHYFIIFCMLQFNTVLKINNK